MILNNNGGRQLNPLASSVPAFVDVNRDSFVSPIDALMIINSLSTVRAPLSGGVAVPEPTAGMLLIWLLAVLARTRGRVS